MTDETAEADAQRETAAPSVGGRRVDIVIPSPMHGSGGHRTAVNAGETLAGAGFDVHIHFDAPAGDSVVG